VISEPSSSPNDRAMSVVLAGKRREELRRKVECKDLNSSDGEGPAGVRGCLLCLYLETITAAPLRRLARVYVPSSHPAVPPHSIVTLQSETAGKAKWYMGIVVEPKEVVKARYINTKKGIPFPKNEWYLQNFSTPASMTLCQMTQINTISPL
jgi:hypothetical protein